MIIPRNIIGKDMNETVELPLANKSINPMIDNTDPQMINIFPMVLFRFIALVLLLFLRIR
jgi:hypothetical protein